jgi:hypothetical protein
MAEILLSEYSTRRADLERCNGPQKLDRKMAFS